MWRSLRSRLLLATILVALIAAGVTAFVAARRTTVDFQRYVERRSPMETRRLSFLLGRVYLEKGGWEGIQADIENLGKATGERVVLADAAGRVIADSDNRLIGRAVDTRWPAPTAPVLIQGVLVGALYINPVAGPNEVDAAFLSAVNRSLLTGALIAGLAAVALTLALSARILRPVQRLTAAAGRMEQGDLAVRVDVDTEDEIGQLAQAFNAMAAGLAHQEQLRRNMVSDVAHELRTPLTNLRGYLEAARDGLVEPGPALVDNLYEETMLLGRIVADLQDLALAEAGQVTLVRQPAELTGIVEQAVAMLRPQAEAKGVALTIHLPSGLPAVDVDAGRIGQVLRNLLANALAHTPPGGQVRISGVARHPAGRDEMHVAVSVSDTGAGIAPEHLPSIFDRFYRADRSRARQTGGAGLGLAIVKQIVLAHGGSVSAASEPGRGTTLTFTVPIARNLDHRHP